MPTYQYQCDNCGVFDLLRPMAERDAHCSCPACSGDAYRIIVSAPALSAMSAAARTAYATNERASHAPMTSGDYRPYKQHLSGCGCCSAGGSKVTAHAVDGSKGFPTRRPWMISH